ncbi:MFS transporter [Pandoraea terrae]|uniref:MFS transporter n=1 Tax=Pandoraea terrae TaxID=1537710 RepID=A0A5E4RP83_9BURK|nr:MFS transporter [Pandoraea terrae]VVD65196.1 MFS transporter [Pandoraea terrae]
MTTPLASNAHSEGAGAGALDIAPTRARWRIFSVIFVLVMMNLLDRISLSIAMPTIAKEFSLSPAMQGLVLSSFFWTYALLQIPGGWLIDRFGPRKMITGATALWGACQALAAFATGGASLLVTRAALGGAEAPLFPAGAKLNALWLAPGERSRGAVLVDAGSPLGAALGGIVISWLILSFDSWRSAFFIAGAVTVLMSWISWRYLRDDAALHPGVNAAELAHIRAMGPGATSLADITGRISPRSWFGLTLGRASWAMVYFGLLTWGPSYLSHARGFDLKQIGMATFLIFLSGAFGSLASGFGADALMRRLPRNWVLKGMLTFSGVVIATVFLILPRIADPIEAVCLLCLAAFITMWGSLYWSLPAILAPRARVGIVGASMNLAGSLGGMLIPIVVGLMLQRFGTYETVLHFFAACAFVFIGCTLLIDLRQRRA